MGAFAIAIQARLRGMIRARIRKRIRAKTTGATARGLGPVK